MATDSPRKKTRRGKRGSGAGSASIPAATRASDVQAEFHRRAAQIAQTGSFADFQSHITTALGGFDGANPSDRRGHIIWPTVDTRRELDRYSRSELTKRARWLRANNGLANRIVRGLAELVGYLTPVAMTGDEAWDEAAEDLWIDRAEEATVIDASGKFGARQLQIEANAAAFGDGDILFAIEKNNTAGGLRLVTYESHQIDQPYGLIGDDTNYWHHGVRINKFGKHLEYHLVDYTLRGQRIDGATISARDCIYYAHWDAPGRVRPPTILARAINHLLDIAEIAADWKTSIKVSSLFGVYLKNAMGGNAPMGPRAITSNLRDETIEEPDEAGEGGTKIKVEDVLTPAGDFANLPEGADLQTIVDSRPHPNQMALIAFLIRDIAWGAGVSPEIIWDLSTLRGANNRLANADLQRWIGQKLIRQKSMMKRMWTTFIAKEIESGRLANPRGNAPWWKHTFIPQASITADKGREGKLNIDLVQSQLRSLATHYGEEGVYWLRELRQISRERRTMQDLGIGVVAAQSESTGDSAPPADNEREDLW